MLNAIGSSTFSGYTGTGSAAAGLQAQLDRYQKILSDCVNCDSAKTREGKVAIQDISSKISEVKARLEELTATKSNTQPAAPNPTATGLATNGNGLSSRTQDSTAATFAASAYATVTVGSRLNIFA